MSSGLPVCGRCGAVSTPDSPSCEVCGGSGTLRAPPARPDRYYVGIRASFTCRACGFLAPLDKIDASGAAHCVRCGLDQAFDGRQWRAALAFAHAVGDLAGPSVEGLHPNPRLAIDSPYSDVARTRTTVAFGEGEAAPGVLFLRAFPGHPLCSRCAKPASVAASRPGVLAVSCVCGLQEEHQLVGDVRPGFVAGAIGTGHRGGVAPAAVESGAAFQCPTCGAPLPVDGKARILTCHFCHVASRIPDAAFRKVAAVDPETIWVAFSGASSRRRELEQKAEERKITTPEPAKPSQASRAMSAAWRLGLPSAALALAIVLVGAALYGSQALGIVILPSTP